MKKYLLFISMFQIFVTGSTAQVFITDTHAERIHELFEQNNSEHLIYIVNNRTIVKHG